MFVQQLPIVVSIALILLQILPANVKTFAESPSFSRQVIKNSNNVEQMNLTNGSILPLNNLQMEIAARSHQNGPDTPIISSVSYFSDGRTLNTTLWVNPISPNIYSQSNPDSTPRKLVIVIEKLPMPNMTLESYSKISINRTLSLLPPYAAQIDRSEISNTTLAGHPANKLVFTYEGQDQENYICMKLWMINEDRVYNIYYFAREAGYLNSLPTVQRMINSFKYPSIYGFNDYTNTSSGVSIQYPSKWLKANATIDDRLFPVPRSTYNGSVLFFSPDNSTVYLETDNLPSKSVSLSYLTNYFTGILNPANGFKMIEFANTTLGHNIPANKFVFSSTLNGVVTDYMIIAAIKDGKLYLFEYYGEPTHYVNSLPIVQRMVDSFQIKSSITPITNEMNKLLTYSDASGLVIQYPEDWSPSSYSNDTIVFEPNNHKFGNEIPIYGLLIDADSNPSTGVNGIDYKLEVRWNDDTQTWVEYLFEYSANGYNVKITDLNKNFTGISNDYTYVSIPLNLHAIGAPNKFKVIFFTEIINKESSYVLGSIYFPNVLVDVTNWVDIPPPEYTYLTTPNPLNLRQGDQEIIGAQLRSSDGIVPDVANVLHVENTSVIKWHFNPDGRNRLFNVEPEPFEINIPSNAQIGQYTIPMLANISEQSAFPARFLVFDLPNEFKMLCNCPIYFTGPLAHLTAYEANLKPTIGYTTVPVNLTIGVLKPVDLSERFKGFWDVWGQPISLIAGGFAAGLASLTLDRMKKRKKLK